jgi:DNA-binding GntR family transcriptional regulator
VRPLTLEDLRDTYFTRISLESLALLAAADRFTAREADDARAALREQDAANRAGDRVGARDAHERFHFTLYRASGSEWLVRSLEPAWRNSERYRVESMRDPGHVRRRAEEHGRMLTALEAGDGRAAAALLASHLRSTADLVATRLGGG